MEGPALVVVEVALDVEHEPVVGRAPELERLVVHHRADRQLQLSAGRAGQLPAALGERQRAGERAHGGRVEAGRVGLALAARDVDELEPVEPVPLELERAVGGEARAGDDGA